MFWNCGGPMFESDTLKREHPYLFSPRPAREALSPPLATDPTRATLVNALAFWAGVMPDREALVSVNPDGSVRRHTYRQLKGLVDSVAARLAGLGIGPGARVAVSSAMSDDVIVAYLAVLSRAATVVPLDPRWDEQQLRFFLGLTGCSYALCHGNTLAAVRQLVPNAAELAPAVAMAAAAPPSPSRLTIAPPSNWPAVILSTSGTTAEPKAPCLSHANLISNAEALRRVHGMVPGARSLCVLPLFHANAFGFSFAGSIYWGGTLILCCDYLKAISEVARVEGARVVSLVPELLRVFADARLVARDMPKLQYVVSAAAPLSVELAALFHRRTGLRIQQGWGLSECTNFAATLPRGLSSEDYELAMHGFERPSIGTELPDCSVSCVTTDGKETREGEEGELLVRGTNVMMGYWGRPDLTDQVLCNGVLRTGDLGVWREIGGRCMFFVTGRIKEVIIRNGEKVSPAMIERALGTILLKYPAMVIGFPNRHVGDEIGLYVRAPLTEEARADVLQAVARLGETLRPRVILFGETPLPRTSTGKPQRTRLLPLFENYREQLHNHRRPTVRLDGAA